MAETLALRDLQNAARRLKRAAPEYEGVRLPAYLLETNRCYRRGIQDLMREARKLARKEAPDAR